MSTLTTKHLFRVLAILTMGSVFLPVVFNRLPSPFHVSLFYWLLWIPLIAVFHHELLFKKSMLYVYLYLIIFFLGIPFFWEDVVVQGQLMTFGRALADIRWLFGGILMYTYFLNMKDYNGLAWVILAAFIFISITSIVSIIGLQIKPEVVRMVMSGRRDEIDIGLRTMGIGTYGFFNGVAFLLPTIVYFIRQKEVKTPVKFFIIAFIVLSITPMILANITATFLTATAFVLVALFAKGRFFNYSLWIVSVLIVFLFVFNTQTASFFYAASGWFGEGIIKERTLDLGRAVELGDYDPEHGVTYFSTARLSRISFSLNAFLSSPIVGAGESATHSYWIDRLAYFGILGFFPWFFIFRDQIKRNINSLDEHFVPFYLISFTAFIIFGLFKGGLVSSQTMLSIFFLAPGVCFLKFLKNTKRN